MKEKIQATARVRITVEVETLRWGENASIGQLYKQSEESAIEEVRKAIANLRRLKIVGKPVVTGIITNAA